MVERTARFALAVALLVASSAEAVVKPPDSPVGEKAFRHPDLDVRSPHQPLSSLQASTAAALEQELTALGVPREHGFYDVRAGRWGSLILSQPLIPGTGEGNALRWKDRGVAPPDAVQIKEQTWAALKAFLRRAEAQLDVDLAELGQPRFGVYDGGSLVQVSVNRVVGGVPVRDSRLTAVINHGNLVLLGLSNWGRVDTTLSPAISVDEARNVAAQHSRPFEFRASESKPQLELVPMAQGGEAVAGGAYDHRLVWAVRGSVTGDLGTWEALVDATTGELLAFEDRNQYASAKRGVIGGIFPVSNDGQPPDGIEQPGFPMPFADLTVPGGETTFTNSGGVGRCIAVDQNNLPQTTLSGRFVNISDTCGAIQEDIASSALLTIDLGFGPGTDCAVPPGHSAGDTHASRTSFYEVNRIIEQGKGYLPDNTWLQSQLTTNVNLTQTCNAFWNGTLNMFRDSGSSCRNTGEIAGVLDHEWGHGMDNNGVNPNISPPGEGIADVHAILRLQDSCMGRGFFKSGNCGGYGDPCTDCSGIRDLDFAKHQSGVPHDLAWITTRCPNTGTRGPCGREVHCEGYIVGEAGWDLFARAFKSGPFFYDNNTALELTTRLFFLGSQTVDSWYQCSPPFGGCNAGGGYLSLLAVDDDNGNLADGTPHMTAISSAFNAHQIACNAPAPVNSGCAGGPNTAPVVTATPVDQGAALSWAAVPGAARYAVYRTEGVHGCDFGKAKVGETTGTTFVDQGLKNDFTYYYTVLPVGSNSACFGRASSCVSVVPEAGANLSALEDPPVEVLGGDGDSFLDNCETGRATITVENNGAVPLTNVRIVSVTPLTHPATVVTTPLPKVIAASLEPCGNASGTFDFVPHGMSFDQTTELEVEVTADELGGQTRTTIVRVTNVESDFQPNALVTWSFENDLEGWVVTAGTFNRQPGGAQGSGFHLSSTQCLDDQCDVVRSPVVRLQQTSQLSLYHRYDTETPVPTPYDRANVGVLDVDLGTRTTVSPSGGKAYDLTGNPPNGACVTANQPGWSADTDVDCTAPATFTRSTWNAAALNPGGIFTGRKTHLSVAYGTDPLVNGYGFDFDHVQLTDFDLQVPDAQACGLSNPRSRTGTTPMR